MSSISPIQNILFDISDIWCAMYPNWAIYSPLFAFLSQMSFSSDSTSWIKMFPKHIFILPSSSYIIRARLLPIGAFWYRIWLVSELWLPNKKAQFWWKGPCFWSLALRPLRLPLRSGIPKLSAQIQIPIFSTFQFETKDKTLREIVHCLTFP